MTMAVDLSEIKYIKRFVVGNDNPQHMHSNEEINRQLKKLNDALNATPKGKIISTEKNFALLSVNEHQILLEWVVYHVGFNRKPLN